MFLNQFHLYNLIIEPLIIFFFLKISTLTDFTSVQKAPYCSDDVFSVYERKEWGTFWYDYPFVLMYLMNPLLKIYQENNAYLVPSS